VKTVRVYDSGALVENRGTLALPTRTDKTATENELFLKTHFHFMERSLNFGSLMSTQRVFRFVPSSS